MKLNEVQREFLQYIHSIDFIQTVSMKSSNGTDKFLHVKSVIHDRDRLLKAFKRWDSVNIIHWLEEVLITKDYTVSNKQWLNSISYQYINLHGNKFKRLP